MTLASQDWTAAMKRLVLAARTSGGTAGLDAELVTACEACEQLLLASESGPDHEDGPDSDGFRGARPWNGAGVQTPEPDGWKEATIAWEVCASIHREYAKKKDPFFTTRQADFMRHAEAARAAMLVAAPAPDHFHDAAVEKAWERFEAELQRGQVKDAALRGEIPMPKPTVSTYEGYRDSAGEWHAVAYSSDQMRAYGDAREDAGYERGLKSRVPLDAINKMLADGMDVAVANGANSVSMPDHYVEVAAWTCGVKDDPLSEDAARYRFITDDHADSDVRRAVSSICDAIVIRGKGATDTAIDALREVKP